MPGAGTMLLLGRGLRPETAISVQRERRDTLIPLQRQVQPPHEHHQPTLTYDEQLVRNILDRLLLILIITH